MIFKTFPQYFFTKYKTDFWKKKQQHHFLIKMSTAGKCKGKNYVIVVVLGRNMVGS